MARLGRWTSGVGVLVVASLLSGCWLQEGFGPEHARFNPLETGITADNVATLHEAWATTMTGSITSETLVSGSRLYVSRRSFSAPRMTVDALDVATGAPVWSHTVVGSTSEQFNASAVSFSGDHLVVGVGSTAAGGIHRLDPATGAETGFDPGLVPGPIVTGDGVVAWSKIPNPFIGDTALVVADASTNAVRFTSNFTNLRITGIAIESGRVYVVAGDRLAAFPVDGCGAATCDPLWETPSISVPGGATIELAGPQVGPADQVVTVTPTHAVLDAQGAPVAAPASIDVRDGATGTLLWSATAPEIAGTVAMAGGLLYAATRAATITDPTTGQPLVSVDGLDAHSLADGSVVWHGDLPGNPAGPTVAADVVYIGAANSTFAFRAGGCGAGTCAPVATLAGVGDPGVVAGGQLYTGTSNPGVDVTIHAFRLG